MEQKERPWGWLVGISCLCFSTAWVLYFMLFSVEVDLGEVTDVPPPITKNLDISQVQDYWVESELMVQKGAQVYATYCALCHGARGMGDGMAGRGLNPPPRDFTKGTWKFGGDRIALFKVISNGSEGTSMAAFSHIPKLERWALVHFVRSLSENKVIDDSDQTKEFAENAK